MSVALEPRSFGSPLRLFGWSGFPSNFVGRPSLLRASSGVAMPPSDEAVAKNSALPGRLSSGVLTFGTIFFGGLEHATAEARERQRRAHQLQKRAPLDRIVPLFSMLRVFAGDEFTKLRRVRQLFETAPKLLAGVAAGSVFAGSAGIVGSPAGQPGWRAVLPAVFLDGENAFPHQFEVYVSVFAHRIRFLRSSRCALSCGQDVRAPRLRGFCCPSSTRSSSALRLFVRRSLRGLPYRVCGRPAPARSKGEPSQDPNEWPP